MNYKTGLVLIVFILLTAIGITGVHHHITEEIIIPKPCCEIIITSENDGHLVTWRDNIAKTNYSIFVEVEYPSEDLSEEEELDHLTMEAINKWQRMCNNVHNNNKIK